MKIVTDIKEWQDLRRTLGKHSLGFVPIMGHLHEGHIALCQHARKENDLVVTSIFVNPTQFNVAADFDAYQRTLEHDCALLDKAGNDYVFFPDAAAMYADNYEVRVSETTLSSELEGEFRPGHFGGMLTVVMKLLNIIQPTRAYFGEKDYQQLLLVKKMAASLFMPVDIVACPTVRAQSGLALSSRNSRLTEDQQAAVMAYQARCHEALNRWFHTIIVVPSGIFPYKAEPGKPAMNLAYQEHIQHLTVGIACDERVECDLEFLSRDCSSVTDRVAEVSGIYTGVLTSIQRDAAVSPCH